MDRRGIAITITVSVLLVASSLSLTSALSSQEAPAALVVPSSGTMVYVGHADIDPNVSEKVYIHPGTVPTNVTLYLWGEKFNPQFYTELGQHSHPHTHALDVASKSGGGYLQRAYDDCCRGYGYVSTEAAMAGVPGGTLSSEVKDWLDHMQVWIDGVDRTDDVLARTPLAEFGDGTEGHAFNTEIGSGEMDITSLIAGAGQHVIEFKVSTGGGRVRYNLYLSLASPASSDSTPVPHLINYQGRLTDVTGNPVPDGNYDMRFCLYDVASGGTALWCEPSAPDTWRSVQVTHGIFSVMLGETHPIPSTVFDGASSDRWLGVQISPDTQEMTPRRRIASVGYAYRAESANTGGSGIPSGMIAMFDTDCPTGWTRFAALDDKFPMGGTTYGVEGGNSTHNHGGVTGLDGMGEVWLGADRDRYAVGHHTHPINPDNHLPPYRTVLFCRKD